MSAGVLRIGTVPTNRSVQSGNLCMAAVGKNAFDVGIPAAVIAKMAFPYAN
jgi:hypothetical protein